MCDTTADPPRCVCFDDTDNSTDCTRSLQPEPYYFNLVREQMTAVPSIARTGPPTYPAMETFSVQFHNLPEVLVAQARAYNDRKLARRRLFAGGYLGYGGAALSMLLVLSLGIVILIMRRTHR